MNRPAPSLLKPRKTPRQARSTATVAIIHTATIQVLLADGATRLTTTRVAERAGVSIGTMYQYYPHKQALLFAILERQLETVESTMLAVVERLAGYDLETIAHELANAWLDAKTANIDASRAIYGIAAEFDIAALMAGASRRLQQAIERLLASASDGPLADLDAAAFMLVALLGGSVRAVMELGASERDLARLRWELPRACHGYLGAVRQSSAGLP
jgi:AcrR family transcriptional regulator